MSREHPLSPADRVPPSLHEAGLSGLGWHQLVCALCDLHGPDRHLVKETNLFFVYADVTSVLEGAEYLRSGDVYVVFADNVDVTHTALPLLAAAVTPGVPAVLASPFDVDSAGSYDVIVCEGTGPVQRMLGLVDKPDRPEECQLLAEHGAGSLRLLQGRMRITQDLLRALNAAEERSASEPKLSLALTAYSRAHPVDVFTTTQPMTDLGLDTGDL
ncbi:hypothetical protein U5640_12790 [Streptomyces sp. SS7]|uniref:hypothetical protein n=1 Tax=Streptomyces sp. SS7 TaxID=3108485 RepID=UPI0030EECF1C